ETEENSKSRLSLALMGIRLASARMEATRLGRDVVSLQRNAGILSFEVAEERLRDLNRYHLAAGAELWQHQRMRMRYTSELTSIQGPRNALLMSSRIKNCFYNHHLVVVPVDATKSPITRWRTEILYPSILQTKLCPGHDASSLYGRELVFLNERRQTPRYLYFHFLMALIRIRDLKDLGWQDIWARYYERCPSLTPGRHIRQSILAALATHFETADMTAVESWIADYGFESPLRLTGGEVTEAARRLHLAVEDVVSRGEEEERRGRDKWEEEVERRGHGFRCWMEMSHIK
ncbi:hypothetical protein BBK36DRAFT_1128189, partial [Trichoderma citrinoviride]